MRYLLTALCVSAGMSLLSSPVVSAQDTPAAPLLSNDQVANILRQLDQLETQIYQNRNESLAGALSACRSAMNSDQAAMELYLNSVKREDFDKRNLKATDFQQWKERNEERLKDPSFVAGLRLQLEFLALSIQAQSGVEHKDRAPHINALMSFMPKVQTAIQASFVINAQGQVEEKNRGKGGNGGGGGGNRSRGGILNQLQEPVTGLVVAKVYRLDEYLKNDKWIYAASDIPGMYDKVIVPYYLVEDPNRVPALLDSKINYIVNLQKNTSSENSFEAFQRQQYPQLLWGKSVFLWEKKIQPVQALADMLRILRENPTHPGATGWLKKLQEVVTKEKEAVAPTVSAVEPPSNQ